MCVGSGADCVGMGPPSDADACLGAGTDGVSGVGAVRAGGVCSPRPHTRFDDSATSAQHRYIYVRVTETENRL